MFFDADMATTAQSRLELEQERRIGVRDETFYTVYQPIVELATIFIVAVEALARWPRPVGQQIGPDEFIPVLEDTRLILPMGRMILARACRDGAHWHRLGHPLNISVNVSALQPDSDDFGTGSSSRPSSASPKHCRYTRSPKESKLAPNSPISPLNPASLGRATSSHPPSTPTKSWNSSTKMMALTDISQLYRRGCNPDRDRGPGQHVGRAVGVRRNNRGSSTVPPRPRLPGLSLRLYSRRRRPQQDKPLPVAD